MLPAIGGHRVVNSWKAATVLAHTSRFRNYRIAHAALPTNRLRQPIGRECTYSVVYFYMGIPMDPVRFRRRPFRAFKMYVGILLNRQVRRRLDCFFHWCDPFHLCVRV